MRTSRIAKETSKMARISSRRIQALEAQAEEARPQQSFAKVLRSYAANGTATENEHPIKEEEEQDDHVPEPFPTAPLSTSNPLKRKRGTTIKVESTIEELSTVTATPSRAPARKRKAAKKEILPTGEVAIHPPLHWEEVYTAVKAMRALELAPVDTMGCETLAEAEVSPRDKRLQTLVALMLSSQTKDTTTAAAMRALQTQLPGGLTLDSIRACQPARLNELIHQVGFHNNKTVYIKKTAEILHADFGGDIPDSPEGLMSLPGVGPKMAHLCMSAAWGRTMGIGVDVHVHRITNLWGWHRTRNPEETRMALEAWLPRDKWHEINHLLVGFGQTLCKPVGRECWRCELSAKGLCPGVVRGAKAKVKTKREAVLLKEEDNGVVAESRVAVKEEEVGQVTVDGEPVQIQGTALDIEDIQQPAVRALRSRRRD